METGSDWTFLVEYLQEPKQILFVPTFFQCIISQTRKLFSIKAFPIKPKMFQALWTIESLLQALNSVVVEQK